MNQAQMLVCQKWKVGTGESGGKKLLFRLCRKDSSLDWEENHFGTKENVLTSGASANKNPRWPWASLRRPAAGDTTHIRAQVSVLPGAGRGLCQPWAETETQGLSLTAPIVPQLFSNIFGPCSYLPSMTVPDNSSDHQQWGYVTFKHDIGTLVSRRLLCRTDHRLQGPKKFLSPQVGEVCAKQTAGFDVGSHSHPLASMRRLRQVTCPDWAARHSWDEELV